ICLATLSDQADNQDFNITRGEGRSLQEAIDILKALFPTITVQEKSENENFRPSRGALDVSKARRLIGYNPQISLEDGLSRYVDFVRRVSRLPDQTASQR